MRLIWHIVYGVTFAVCLSIALVWHKNYCSNDTGGIAEIIYQHSIKEKDAEIKKLTETIKTRDERVKLVHDTIYRDRIKFKTIYEKIPFSTHADRERAFDSLLTK